MSVRGNILYGGGSLDSLPSLGMTPLLDRSVAKLSGGERRRVALARAMATNPRLLLLDELLAGLDDARKGQLIDLLPRPLIFVSHERDEMAALCEHVASIDRGQVSMPSPLSRASAT
jgi:molybdate transport system ATP-binding protein